MGSSILASLSEAGGNDLSFPANRPLPSRLRFSSNRLFSRVCPTFFLLLHAGCQLPPALPFFQTASTIHFTVSLFSSLFLSPPHPFPFLRNCFPVRTHRFDFPLLNLKFQCPQVILFFDRLDLHRLPPHRHPPGFPTGSSSPSMQPARHISRLIPEDRPGAVAHQPAETAHGLRPALINNYSGLPPPGMV